MAAHRASLRAQGLKPVQIWVQDASAPGFAEQCRAWSDALGHDPEDARINSDLEALAGETEGWVWNEEM